MEDKKLLKELAKVSGGADPFPNDVQIHHGAILYQPGHDSAYAEKPLGNYEFEYGNGEYDLYQEL